MHRYFFRDFDLQLLDSKEHFIELSVAASASQFIEPVESVS